jgi:hypothetical protein
VLLPDTSSLLNILEAPTPDEKVSPNIIPSAIACSAGTIHTRHVVDCPFRTG